MIFSPFLDLKVDAESFFQLLNRQEHAQMKSQTSFDFKNAKKVNSVILKKKKGNK